MQAAIGITSREEWEREREETEWHCFHSSLGVVDTKSARDMSVIGSVALRSNAGFVWLLHEEGPILLFTASSGGEIVRGKSTIMTLSSYSPEVNCILLCAEFEVSALHIVAAAIGKA